MVDLPQTLDAAVRFVAAKLAKAGIEPAFTEARLIFELIGYDRMALLKAPDEKLGVEQSSIVLSALEKRLAGMPVARMRGWSVFDGRRFALSPETLEPRDDTLTLVDAVTGLVQRKPNCRILDIGTGTGIIALTLLARAPEAEALATDISERALETALINAKSLNLNTRFSAQKANMFEGVEGKFDLIVSNPPYISSQDILALEREVTEHDPVAALDGGADGLDFYWNIANGAGALMADGGQVAVEIGYDQRQSVADIFTKSGFIEEAFQKDLGGRPRVLVFSKNVTIC
ncbi:MAG: peptide chain release factor N(5)-glutamine methyltransferase [Notoacmeibacter sp.]